MARKYTTNKDYKSITIRFNLKDKEEKKLFVFLNSMGSEDRTTFILELYNQKHVENTMQNNEMSVYEKRLFDIVEKSVVQKNDIGYKITGLINNKEFFNKELGKTFEEKNKLESKKVDYNNIEFKEQKKEKIDYESILDYFTDSGMR